ncbi:MAG: hypothetical protein M3Z27_05330 [Actinomycetota bacterium]|nr:hypothetical protein [Actinomycetota bacterium]
MLVASIALGACGGSSNVAPAAYVKSICQAFGSFKQQVQASTATAKAAHGSLAVRKQAFQTFLGSFSSAASTAASKMEKAGTPDVSNGKQISSRLVSAFTQYHTALDQDVRVVTSLPTNNTAAFARGFSSLSNTMQTQGSAINSSFGGLKSPALDSAGKKEPACRSLGAGG